MLQDSALYEFTIENVPRLPRWFVIQSTSCSGHRLLFGFSDFLCCNKCLVFVMFTFEPLSEKIGSSKVGCVCTCECAQLVAEETWVKHKQRNDSHVVSTFQGQFRSKVTCPVCTKVSLPPILVWLFAAYPAVDMQWLPYTAAV